MGAAVLEHVRASRSNYGAESETECVSEFISFITGEASDKCQREKRKTINGDDLLWAMTTLGFEDYVDPLKVYLQRFREIEGEKTVAARDKDAASAAATYDYPSPSPSPSPAVMHHHHHHHHHGHGHVYGSPAFHAPVMPMPKPGPLPGPGPGPGPTYPPGRPR
ncbi:nuclear transcription factor Y subunit B-10 [Cajanus cajan]|uniref:nuclear transcription factor Y subunit B-10 n=1 Tax=Cajanus cajan TaxID=3821 RepID=UPI00098DBECA|nr:nuclear transcription factor Y subunit B-10 [Cajanus cajan]